MLRHRLLAVSITASLLIACGKASDSASKTNAKATAPQTALLISPEDLRTVTASAHAGGPVITGSIQPEKRAEVSAVAL